MKYWGRLLLRLVSFPLVRTWCRLRHRDAWYVRQWWIDDTGLAWMCRRCGEPWPLSKAAPRRQMTDNDGLIATIGDATIHRRKV